MDESDSRQLREVVVFISAVSAVLRWKLKRYAVNLEQRSVEIELRPPIPNTFDNLKVEFQWVEGRLITAKELSKYFAEQLYIKMRADQLKPGSNHFIGRLF